jgi:hypothetical protein
MGVLPIAIEPVQLWNISEALGLGVVFFILLIFGYLQYDKWRIHKRSQISRVFSDLISEVILCGNEQELKAVLATSETQCLLSKFADKPMARKVLCEELVKTHRSLNGIASQNIQWLFAQLHLEEDVFLQFKSTQWHVKAKAIQQLAEMRQTQYLTKIYKAINHPNLHVRMKAQLAIVKLTGFEGLRFLNVLRYPITPWQQLSLINELSSSATMDAGKLRAWLQSENETVAELALKLIRKYQCYEMQEEITACMQSPYYWVRRQARLILEESSEINFKEVV